MMMSCTQQSHEKLKRDAARWATEVDPIGELDAGGGVVVVMANCRRCRSTLAVTRTHEPRADAGPVR